MQSSSSVQLQTPTISPLPLQTSSQKKKGIIQGIGSQHTIQLQNHNGYPIQGQQRGDNYKRIVNIYSVNNYKKNRKSLAPEARIHLNHSMLPPGGLPYEDVPKRTSGSQELLLPELPVKSSQMSNYQN